MNEQNQWSMPVRYLVFGVVFILLAVGLWYIRSILEPLIIAGFIAYLIHPAVNFLTRRTRLSRPAAVNLVYFITLAVLIGTPSTLAPIFFDEFKQVIADVLNIFNQLIVWLVKPRAASIIPIDFGQLANRLTQFRTTFLSSLPDQALQLLGKTSVGALWILVILVVVYYLLAEWPHLRNGFIGSFPDVYHPELNELYQRVRSIWMNYLRGQLLLMVIVGVTFTIAWTVIGIPGALVLGVVAGFLTLIPDVGPFLAAVLAIGVALLEGSNWSWMPASSFIVALIALAIYLLLITIKNFWLRPFIMGRSVHMHEALVLISIIMATILWGILGALLIVPVLASLVVIFDYLRRRIMGMPPFPPTEPFVLETPPVSGSEKVAALKSIISRKKKG
ncbi:MAG: AI-2E family transporter [Chloroflexi bacterium]|nr:AI-2E family transporter [Chloroflexota bacterium]